MFVVELIVLVASLVLLAKASSTVVETAAKLSKYFGISQVAIGFLLISVSTSIPELSVSLISSAAGEGAIAAGNVFGSNIANILLVLGIGGFLYGLKIKQSELKDIAIILVVTTVISAYIIFNSSVQNSALGFAEGAALLLAFLAYALYILTKKRTTENKEKPVTKKEALHAFLYFFAGIILVIISAGAVVDAAVKIASLLNVAESFIGATVIAIGTSLPELSIDLQAIKRKQYGLAIGDAIGSNMVNITFVLGIAAVINQITITLPIFIAALLFAIVANIALFYVAAVNKQMNKTSSAAFLILYVVYLGSIFYLQLA